MHPPPSAPPRPLPWPRLALALACVGLTALFAVTCWQAPLYYSNQNQYFVHGLAWSDPILAEDWLARCADPTPVFSTIVAGTVAALPPWAFHLEYALVQGAYAVAMLGLFVAVAGDRSRRWPVFLALLLLVHSALVRWASFRWLGNDYPWYLQSGVAGQYLLGAMFQPSVFGVLLVVAVWQFAAGRAVLAAVLIAVGATLHSTYLLPGALLVLGMQAALLVERRGRLALGVGLTALVLVLPVLAYVVLTFRPTSAEGLAEAQAILARVRIPHHTQARNWLDPVAGCQIAWLALGVALARPRRLQVVLAVAFNLALALTVAQVLTGSDALALLFPWRVSAVLVPVSTAVILARLVSALPAAVAESRGALIASGAVAAVCVGGGLWIGLRGLGFSSSDEELPVYKFARSERAAGQVYFLPVRVPNLAATVRGSLSSDFKPLGEKKTSDQVIPVDMQRFRLHAGVPIYVDFKSVPYRDDEVVEWYRRAREAEAIRKLIEGGRTAEAVVALRRIGATHLVWPARPRLRAAGLRPVQEAPFYRVYAVEAAP